MKRKEAESKYKWNLIDLYKTDEEFFKDLDLYIKKNKELLKYKTSLNTKTGFLGLLRDSIVIESYISKINHFLKLLYVEQKNERLINLESIYSKKMQQFDGKFSWINEEIKNVGEKQILEWLQTDEKLKYYSKSYKDFFKHIKYLLPQRERELISKVSNSSSIIYEMYEIMKFKDNEEKVLDYKDKKYIVNQKLLSDLFSHSDPIKDQELRALCSLKYNENNNIKKHSFAKVFESIIKEEIESAQIIGMKSFKENFFDDDDFSFQDFLNLLSFTSKNSKVFYSYYQIIKDYLKLEKFYGTDSNLELVKVEKRSYSVEDAKNIIRNSLKVLGEEYISNLEYCWSDNKIDYFEDKNKSTGAFTVNSYTYDSLIAMNFTNDIDSISTLAHEIGHAVHNLFAKQNQPRPLNGFSNMIAEVASTFNEHLLFDYLLKNEKNENKKLKLIQNRIEFIFNNFFSAIADAEFEFQCYQESEKGTVLTLDKISEIVKESNRKILGKSIFDKFNPESYKFSWISISHLFEQPFYIYKYAVSIAVSFKLYSEFKKTNNSEQIINFLKEGGNLEITKLFLKYGFDCKDENSYKDIINEANSLVKDFEKLLLKKQLN
ncbi:M3 family metallopeptidase [Spiroplasma floricola]|uniref:Oligoendopeptidase F n=1 Tax=Spiroplasma floricola 23-6 TaxID=1336749 RepID=A0A2K8SDG0_9MOLU|nr:M3 family metallopeptidase [Spiroplasma floricola]AUB31507.1 oligoendopeptidase F [Spiroplasma floricola 23-6]